MQENVMEVFYQEYRKEFPLMVVNSLGCNMYFKAKLNFYDASEYELNLDSKDNPVCTKRWTMQTIVMEVFYHEYRRDIPLLVGNSVESCVLTPNALCNTKNIFECVYCLCVGTSLPGWKPFFSKQLFWKSSTMNTEGIFHCWLAIVCVESCVLTPNVLCNKKNI